MDLKEKLQKIFKGELLDDEETLKTYSRDASLFEVKPRMVVFPKDASDIENLVKFVSDNPQEKLSLTARSGGTDMTGGPLNQSIIVEFVKYFNKIKEVGIDYAVTEPGVYYRDFEKETLKHNLLLPSYPASREICTVGGIAANNSGGEKTLVYGKTENYVKKLKTILSDGKEYIFEPLDEKQLNKKLTQKDFEGEIYTKIHKLIMDNLDLLKEAKPKVSKNSAGYYLWNVWDGHTFDLCKLLVGSQGTLGINTEITFKLIKPQKHTKLLVAFLKDNDIEKLGEIVNLVLEYDPESFESYDDNTLKLAVRFFPDVLKFFKADLISLGLEFIPEAWMSLTGGMPKLVLMAEFTGESEEDVIIRAKACKEHLERFNLRTRIARPGNDTKKYWVIRRESFNLLRHHIQGKHTAPFIDDIVVDPKYLPEFLPKLNALLSKYPKLIYTVAGHVGNGNFHIIPLMDLKEKDAPEIIKKLSMEVYDLVLEYKGSITGEHNDGLIRSPYLKKMYGEKVYSLFEEVKKIFDPDNIFNPGKKVGGTISYSMHHLEKD